MKTTRIIETQSETIKEVTRLLGLNRFVSVRPAWIYNPAITSYDKQYVIEEDYVVQRGVDEIIGPDMKLDDLKAEIIDIQRESQFQSQVVSELNKRYNATPDEINLMFFRTNTHVPRQYRSLTEYKESGNWPGNPRENNIFHSGCGDNPLMDRKNLFEMFDESKATKNKTTKKTKKNKHELFDI